MFLASVKRKSGRDIDNRGFGGQSPLAVLDTIKTLLASNTEISNKSEPQIQTYISG